MSSFDPLLFTDFQTTIWQYYKENKRSFPWRNVHDPYYILVSEIMLQQTQTYRVIPKYLNFIDKFPTLARLAESPTRDLLIAWQGLGYNRRALALQKTAQKIQHDFEGIIPHDPLLLKTLPGIGEATAGSIAAFAYNKPTIFIETNIRSVYIHFFAAQTTEVKDSFLMPLIEITLPRDNAREWYYALMDYGVMLKAQKINPSRRSAHHTKQSRFEGSDRQIRGMILKLLTVHEFLEKEKLYMLIERPQERIDRALKQLFEENFLACTNTIFRIA